MSERIRVLFAIGTMGGGGAERQVVEILKHLDRARFEPCLYLIRRTGELLSEVPADVPSFAFWERHADMGLKFPGRIRWTQERDLAAVIRERRIDVVYDRCYLMTLLSAVATKTAGVPRVSVAVVDPDPELRLYARWSVRLAWRRARRAYATADRVLANSAGLRRRMIDYFQLPEQNVETLYNLLDVERVDRLAAEPCERFEPGCFHVVCCGRLHEQKGQRYLIEAIDEVVNRRGRMNVRLHLLGQGKAEQELRSLVGKRGLQQHVAFAGYVANPLPHVCQADLFCLPSLYEGMPNALIEAVACRVPVLSTDCPSGPSEILSGGRFGTLVPPKNASALAAAIDDAYCHLENWKSRVESARVHVEAMFSVRQGMSRLETLLSQLAGR